MLLLLSSTLLFLFVFFFLSISTFSVLHFRNILLRVYDFIAFNISMCMFKGMKVFGLFEPISNEKELNFNIRKLGRASKIYRRSLGKIKTSILSKCINATRNCSSLER